MKGFARFVKELIIAILLCVCAFFLVRVISNKAEKVQVKNSQIEVDAEKVNELCKEFGPELYFYPGDFNKTKIVKNITTYQGIDYSLVYTPQYYYDYNENARNACGIDARKLIKYFVTTDMAQGVRANETFDVASYYNANKDLREQFGPNFEAYYRHYMSTGHNEPERKVLGVQKIEDQITVYDDFDYASVFDAYYYYENNPDLQKELTLPGPAGCIDDAKALQHFVDYGVYEYRQAKENFDIVSFFLLNTDLWDVYKDNMFAYLVHYVNNNEQENRVAVGNHNVEEFESAIFELKPAIEKETIRILNRVGYSLYSAFYWCADIPYTSLPLNWSTEGYALYTFANWRGNCYSKASAFYYMARMLGYDAHILHGYVLFRNSTELAPHGWVEINGLVYDPDFEGETGRGGYGFHYGREGTWVYSDYCYVN